MPAVLSWKLWETSKEVIAAAVPGSPLTPPFMRSILAMCAALNCLNVVSGGSMPPERPHCCEAAT